jgi:ribonuclease HII
MPFYGETRSEADKLIAAVARESELLLLQNAPHPYVIGIDEVGLGACAGPLVVAGAVARRGWKNERVKDSKKFSDNKLQTAHQKREAVLHEVIKHEVLYYIIEQAEAEHIDRVGVDVALADLGRMIYMQLTGLFPEALVVMDGTLDGNPHRAALSKVVALPKADALIPAVSAASIVAKVHRDNLMLRHDVDYPPYGFAKHKGYPTDEHKTKLNAFGPCPIHRRSYKPVGRSMHNR